MNKAILLFGLLIFLAGCADGKPRKKTFFSDACGQEVDWYTETKVRYGDSYMEVKPESIIRPNSEFRVKLKPRRDALTREVNVDGDSSKSDANADWIDATDTVGGERAGRLDTKVVAVGCVPEVPDDTVFKFIIGVDKVGDLDPRARVIRK